MYQNVHFDRKTNTIHYWDDELGYKQEKYHKYAYVPDANGAFESIYGEKLRKIGEWDKYTTSKLHESDINPIIRFLIDTYGDSDEISTGHTVVTFDIEVEMVTGLPDLTDADNAITSIALHDSTTDDYYVYVISDLSIDKKIKKAIVQSFPDEDSLLLAFLNKWEQINPTIITGWNIDYFDITYLYNRIKTVFSEGVANRLSPIGIVDWNERRGRYLIAGVSSLDYLALYKNFTYSELANYRLDTIAKEVLGRGKIEYVGSLDELFRDDIETFVEYNLVDVELVVDMDRKLQFIDLARSITHAGHTQYEDFLFSSKWLEGAILTFLRRNNRIATNSPPRLSLVLSRKHPVGTTKLNMESNILTNVPGTGRLKISKSTSSYIIVSYDSYDGSTFTLSKPLEKEAGTDYKVALDFVGAYVKEPITGLYKWVYDLDLTSLYPSIIMSLNISPETKMGKVHNFTTERYISDEIDEYIIEDSHGDYYPAINKAKFQELLSESNYSVSSNGVLYRQDKVGVIAEILDVWFKKRTEYTKLMKSHGKAGATDLYKFYDRRQHTQKIMLNSLYGCLGLATFRFYDLDNAAAVTECGQTIIKTTEKIANAYYNEHINPHKLTLENGKELIFGVNEFVTLMDGSKKQVGELTEDDDIVV